MHIGYIWSYCNPVDCQVFFKYQRGRGNKYARPVLQNFKGYLHTDDYNVYKHFGTLQGAAHVNCKVHARRKFHEAKFIDCKRGEHVLVLYGKLHHIKVAAVSKPLVSISERI